MTLQIHPGTAEGTVHAPGSKSITHRALFTTLLAGGGTIQTPLWSHDTKATLDAVNRFGADTIATTREAVARADPVHGAEIDAANSGTTLRLATAIAALASEESILTGDDSLLARPIQPLVDALSDLGAQAQCQTNGTPPVRIQGPLTGAHATIRGDISSQFISALLLIAPCLPNGLTLELSTPLTSRPYVGLTTRTMNQHGVTVQQDGADTFRVEPQAYQRATLRVPGDYSAAAFPLVAGAITNGRVTVQNLPPDTGQGDEALPSLMERFGCRIEREGDALALRDAELEPAHVDVGDNPDLFPPLAVLAACAPGESVLDGAPHLRDKECDRIDAMVDGLTRLGVEVEALTGGARIQGGALEGGTVNSRGDHRIQMSFAIAALAARDPIRIEGPTDAHAVSYPGFWDAMERLGARVEAVDESGPEVHA